MYNIIFCRTVRPYYTGRTYIYYKYKYIYIYSWYINCCRVAVLSRTLRGGGTVRPGRFQSHDLLRPEIEIEGFLLLILLLLLVLLLTTVSPTDKGKVGRRRNVRVQNLGPSGHGKNGSIDALMNRCCRTKTPVYAYYIYITYIIIIVICWRSSLQPAETDRVLYMHTRIYIYITAV